MRMLINRPRTENNVSILPVPCDIPDSFGGLEAQVEKKGQLPWEPQAESNAE